MRLGGEGSWNPCPGERRARQRQLDGGCQQGLLRVSGCDSAWPANLSVFCFILVQLQGDRFGDSWNLENTSVGVVPGGPQVRKAAREVEGTHRHFTVEWKHWFLHFDDLSVSLCDPVQSLDNLEPL